ncbi:uncharacterized protein LOC135372364 [Ornithodoros turicata]|uniref:uncharacterized protein LOC135372364 n=1 Tax=Ornithodoros turicata TaxID=34597 RepID=UPI003139C808
MTVLKFPPDDLLCGVCGARVTSREKLENHLKSAHDFQVYWLCSLCDEKEASSAKTMSSHYTKCKRKLGQRANGAPFQDSPRPGPSGAIDSTRHPEPPAQTHHEDKGAPFQDSPQLDPDGAIIMSAPEPRRVAEFTGSAMSQHPPTSLGVEVAQVFSHGRWTESEVAALAQLEVALGSNPFMKQELTKVFPTRSLMAIRMMRHQERYKRALQRIKEAVSTQLVTNADNEVREEETIVFSVDEIMEDMEEAGLHNRTLATNLANVPMSMGDWSETTRHFGVAVKDGTQRTRGRPKRNVTLPKTWNARRRAVFREHQRLYKLGSKVLALQLIMDQEGDGQRVTLKDVHELYDPLFSSKSRRIEGDLRSDGKTSVEVTPFLPDEVIWAMKSLDKRAAPGPDGLTRTDLAKIPPKILTHILNNFLAFQDIPEEMKASRTVFIPKKANP